MKYKFCCQSRESDCPEWISWDQSWILGYFIFTTLAVLFGLLSAIFVSNYAPYAAGSGIPEVMDFNTNLKRLRLFLVDLLLGTF